MARYYARRAESYERIYQKPGRQADLRRIEAWLTPQFSGRRVLELACGTGWWTPFGARDALDWLATDINPETLAIARTKPLPGCVRFATVDAYALDLPPTGTPAADDSARLDAAFAGFWWSHVPLARLPGWLDRLHALLPAGARLVMLDNRYVPGSSTPISRVDDQGNGYQQRALDDGSTHEVLKNFPTAQSAIAALGPRACDPQWLEHSHYWLLTYTLS